MINSQVLDILLDIFQVEQKSQEGIAESILDVLIFILRSRCEDLKLKHKICDCVTLLSKYPNGKKELVADSVKLEDFRYAVQDGTSVSIQLSVLETCLNLCHFPRGANALVNAGYWKWILSTIETQPDASVREKSFFVLHRLKTECNLPQSTTAVTKSLIRTLLMTHFNLDNGHKYSISLLEFCISISRLHDIKVEFIVNDAIQITYEKFVRTIFLESSGVSGSEQSMRDSGTVQVVAKAIQFLSSLVVMVEGKKKFLDAGVVKIFYDSRMYIERALQRTIIQLLLLVAEHPEIRSELVQSHVVDELRSLLLSEAASDEFVAKITQKCLDLLFWKP